MKINNNFHIVKRAITDNKKKVIIVVMKIMYKNSYLKMSHVELGEWFNVDLTLEEREWEMKQCGDMWNEYVLSFFFRLQNIITNDSHIRWEW